MKKTKVTSGLTMSLDGYAAGHNQSFEKPFGDNFDSDLLDRWMFAEPEKHRHKKEIDAPVFVLSHNERASIEMEGGTIFHFVTDGIESACRKAKEVAEVLK